MPKIKTAYGLPILENAEFAVRTIDTAVTSGNNVFGAWTQIRASCPAPTIVTRVHVATSSANTQACIIEVGWGAAGAEVPIGQVAGMMSSAGANPDRVAATATTPPLAFPTIPAGARIAVRTMSDVAANTLVSLTAVRGDLVAGTGFRQARPGDLIGITWDDIALSSTYQTLVTDGRAALITDVAVGSAGTTDQVVLAYGPAGAEHQLCTINHHGGQANSSVGHGYQLPFPVFLPAGARLAAKTIGNQPLQIGVSGLRIGTSPQDGGDYGRGDGLGRYRIR